jgi:hypothetical protein
MNMVIRELCDADLRSSYQGIARLADVVTVGMVMDAYESEVTEVDQFSL